MNISRFPSAPYPQEQPAPCSLYQRGTFLCYLGFGLFFATLPLFFLLHFWLHNAVADFMAMTSQAAGMGCMLYSMRLHLEWRQRLSAVLETFDCSGVGLVLEAMYAYPRWGGYHWAEVKQQQSMRRAHIEYVDALLTLLPRLQAEEWELLTASQVDILLKSLRLTDTYLVLVILEVLSQYGEERVLTAVQRLAEGHDSAEYNVQVRKTAQECLEAVSLRMRSQNSHLSLLRAAAAPQAVSEELLRAAHPAKATKTEELLCSSQREE